MCMNHPQLVLLSHADGFEIVERKDCINPNKSLHTFTSLLS
jgi:hypothetical protein